MRQITDDMPCCVLFLSFSWQVGFNALVGSALHYDTIGGFAIRCHSLSTQLMTAAIDMAWQPRLRQPVVTALYLIVSYVCCGLLKPCALLHGAFLTV
jgi:hypothetical protein